MSLEALKLSKITAVHAIISLGKTRWPISEQLLVTRDPAQNVA